ncbi:MAG TPA: MBL fold metallo-hydrolase [Patescibacteria group bacterium]|nr:MBL fold metallo-hydrolase [Patescibacteria group bacterium]
MDISYLGHSSFRIKTKDVVIVTDPYDPQMVGLKFPKIEADIITVSHDHKDHNNTPLVAGARMVVNSPGEYEIQGVSIIGFDSYHDDKKGSVRGSNTMFLIECEGVKLLHMGDLGHLPDKKIFESMGDIDVLMIPVGGTYTIGSKEASEIVKELEPSFILPMHYKVPGLKEETFGTLQSVDDFLKECGYDTENLDKLSFKKELIDPEVTKVIVLNKK